MSAAESLRAGDLDGALRQLQDDVRREPGKADHRIARWGIGKSAPISQAVHSRAYARRFLKHVQENLLRVKAQLSVFLLRV
jgi:hypothetical protein